METAAVLGAGNMGTALAQVIAANGHAVRLWSIETDVLEELRDGRKNTKYLPGVEVHEGIEPVWDLAPAVSGAAVVLVSVPSHVVRGLARDLAPVLKPGQIVVNVAKGLEQGTHKRMSQVLTEELGDGFQPTCGSLAGPAIAAEMAQGQPMAVIVGIAGHDSCVRVQLLLQNHHLKVETTTDLCGLELCAVLKNVYAIALGMCDGLGYGTNAKAFVTTQAVTEMAAICKRLGGAVETVAGLAGIGDLLTTGFSAHSRNRTVGEIMGKGGDWQQFAETNTVEGIGACRAISELLDGNHHQYHLLATIHEALFSGRPAPDALRHFFREFTYG